MIVRQDLQRERNRPKPIVNTVFPIHHPIVCKIEWYSKTKAMYKISDGEGSAN